MSVPDSIENLYDGRVRTAIELARQAGQATLEHFGKQIAGERKGDNSPGTIADKQAEQLIRAELARRFSDDAILGEEFGRQPGGSEFEWIIDPIDGTKSFIAGVPLYSTLVAVLHAGQPVCGVIYIPALDELVFAARGEGAWHSCQGSAAVRCHVSNRDLNDGTFLTSQVDLFQRRGRENIFQALQAEAYVTRTWGDGYGYLLVATGRAELMLDPMANAWDLAAIQVVVDEAGGRFTDWQGNSTAFGGDGIGSNGRVHQRALQLTRSDA